MRRTTRNKWYGRINASQSLQLASAHLSEAIQMADKPTPFTQKLDQALIELKAARDHIVNHNIGRKRLIARIDTERQRIAELLEDIKHIPLFPEERATARVERDKRNDLAAHTVRKDRIVGPGGKGLPNNFRSRIIKGENSAAGTSPSTVAVSKSEAKRKRPVKKPVRKKVRTNAPKSKN